MEIQKHYIDANGNHFVAVLAGAPYTPPSGATEVTERPSPQHVLRDDEWVYTAPPSPTAAAVKDEAARRIDLIMKDYEQRNALALGQEMVLTHGPDITKWPTDMQATLAVMMDRWAAIKAIRAKSDEIEAMSPIPADIADDRYWGK